MRSFAKQLLQFNFSLSSDVSQPQPQALNVTHVLVVLADKNPALSSNSRSTVGTAAALAVKQKLSVMFLDEDGKPLDESRMQRMQHELEAFGFSDVNVIEETVEPNVGKGSLAVGEAADTLGADLVVLHSDAIHEKHVDANLLAEFVPCPVLLLP